MSSLLQTGFGKAAITPPAAIYRMVGKRRVIEDIFARAVVISAGSRTVAVVLLDVNAIDRAQADPIRRAVCRAIGLPPHALALACTHNHSGGLHLVAWVLQRPNAQKKTYLEFLRRQVLEAVRQAWRTRRPMAWGWARGRVTDLARNRRLQTPDGRVRTLRRADPLSWPLMDDPAVTAGPVDEELLLLTARDEQGEVRGVLANFAVHNSVAGMDKAVCPDVFGVAMAELERQLPGATALITNGAEGNVDPTRTIPHLGPRDYPEALRGGKSLAGTIAGLVPQAKPLRDARLSSSWKRASFPVNEVFRQIAAGQRAFAFPEVPHLRGALPAFRSAARTGRVSGFIQRISIGEVMLIALPGEAYSETQLRIKALRPAAPTAVVGLANGCLGYIPTAQAMAQGGYDATPSEWVRLTAEAEDIILMTVKELMGMRRRGGAVAEGLDVRLAGVYTY